MDGPYFSLPAHPTIDNPCGILCLESKILGGPFCPSNSMPVNRVRKLLIPSLWKCQERYKKSDDSKPIKIWVNKSVKELS